MFRRRGARREAQSDQGPLGTAGQDVERASETSGPLLHDIEAVMTPGLTGLADTDSVVGDLDLYSALDFPQADPNT